jgi:hypothetical protein
MCNMSVPGEYTVRGSGGGQGSRSIVTLAMGVEVGALGGWGEAGARRGGWRWKTTTHCSRQHDRALCTSHQAHASPTVEDAQVCARDGVRVFLQFVCAAVHRPADLLSTSNHDARLLRRSRGPTGEERGRGDDERCNWHAQHMLTRATDTERPDCFVWLYGGRRRKPHTGGRLRFEGAACSVCSRQSAVCAVGGRADRREASEGSSMRRNAAYGGHWELRAASWERAHESPPGLVNSALNLRSRLALVCQLTLHAASMS